MQRRLDVRGRGGPGRSAFAAAVALLVATLLLLAQACTNTDVVGVVVGAVTVTPDEFSLSEGEDQQFRALVVDANGEPIPRATVVWESDHPEILTIDGEGMAQAVARGTAIVTATFRGVDGNATVTVNPGPAITLSVTEVAFRGAAGAQSPAEEVIEVTNGGGGILGGLAATVTFGANQPDGWLTATLAADQANTTLTLTPQTQTLPLGAYDATVSVASPDDDNSPVLIPVTLSLTSFTITESDGSTSVDEAGSTDDFTVVLDAAPESDVVLSVTSSDTAEITVAPAELTFTPSDWDQPQTVTVTGVQDQAADGDRPTDVMVAVVDSLSDDAYDPIPDRAVSVIVQDDDAAGIGVTPTSGLVTSEGGGQATFTVVLQAQPTSDMTIGLSSSDPGEGMVSPSSLTFTPSDWSTPRTVTVTGVNDEIDDDDVDYSIVTAPAVSTDPAFDGLDAADVSVTNTDDADAAGITVNPSGGLLTTESGGQATFTVVLNSQPIDDVVIDLSSSDTSEGTVSPTSVMFTATNWNIAQFVTISSQDDALPDGDLVYSIVTSAAASADPKYDGLNPADVSVTNVDDETAGITVAPASGPTTEAGGQATFTVVLNNEPAADVTIDLNSSDTGEGTISTPAITFTAANWATPRTVTVTGVDDDIDDGDIVYTIVTSPATSMDVNYSGINAANVSLANVDDDQAGFLVSPPSGPTTEAGGQTTFTVRLTSEPLASVSTALSSSDTGEGTVSPTSLSFTTADWSTPQTVTVTGQDDAVADGNVTYAVVTAPALSSDPAYDGLDPDDIAIANVDDETAGITVSGASGPTTEPGGAATFTVVLNTQPASSVTIGLSSSDLTEGVVSASSVTFTTANWNVAQTVTVTGVDDDVDDGNVVYSIVTALSTSSDPDYDGVDPANVPITNVDDDEAGFAVSPPSGPTTEAGGQATFTVRLTSQPSANVTIPLSSSDSGEGTVNPTSLTFTSANWSLAQAVTVTGRDDAQADGNVVYVIVTGAATSSDPGYSGQNPADVALTNVDNETAGVTVSPVSGPTTEAGGQATFTVVLNAEPTADVTIGLSSSDVTEGTISTSTLIFDATNWNSPQTVTITGVDDDVDDDNVVYTIATAPITSSDPTYDGINPHDVSVTNVDDDTAGFIVIPPSGPTTEAGGQATFSVRLTSQPTASVSIGLGSSDTSEGVVSPTGLTFTAADWDIAQTVTVTGQDDAQADGNVVYAIVTAVATSTDSKYSGLNPPDVSMTNIDDETAGITVSPASRATTEAGGQATFTVVLNTQPTASVTVGLSSDDTTEGTIAVSSVTFTTANWNVAQTVTVTGVDDDVDDGDVVYSILTAPATSGDANYDNSDPADVAVTNVDDDAAGFVVSAPSGPTTEAGGQATFTIELASQPSANVTIGLTSSDTSEGTLGSSSLTFTPGNWSTPQAVTVTGRDDALADGNVAYTIVTAAATSSDPGYNGLNPADVPLTNVDDETPGITVSPATGPTTEAGGQAMFTVALNNEPTANVTVGLSSSDVTEGTVAPMSLTFTPSNWDSPQTVVVTGIDDAVDDDNVVYTIITAPASSSDASYNGLNPADVSVTNVDDDAAGFNVTPASGPTTEAGGQATFSIVLTSEPTAAVTVDLSSSDATEGTVSPTSLTFTSGDWSTVRTVTVTGVDDAIDDGNVVYTVVTAPASSTDPKYGGLNPADVAFTNIDDETTGISVSAASGPTTEAGGQATFTVRLLSQPEADVTIGLSSSDPSEGDVSPTSLTFTTASWNTARTVTVTGVDDDIDDGDVVFSIVTAPAASLDTSYDGVDAADVQVTNNDDDAAGFTISPPSSPTTEGGGQATFTLALTSEPTASLTIGLTSSDIGEGTVSPASLTFTTASWSTPQTVTVTGVDDDVDDGNVVYSIVTAPASSTDPTYNGRNPANVSITNVDDDTAGFLVSAPSGPTTEAGGQATFTIALTSRPGANVTVGLTSSDTGEGVVDLASLTFTTANWSVPQTVTVTGVEDFIADGNVVYSIVTAAAGSADEQYNALNPPDVSITNVDDESVGITVTPASGPTTEAGDPATFSVVLNTQPQPAASVTIGLTSSDTSEGTVSPSSLTFTTANWNVQQTVTVTGVDDDVDDDNVAYTIVTAPATSADGDYDGLDPANVSVTNVDDDIAGFTVSAASGPTSEAGGQATFTVALTSEPIASVSVGLTSSDDSEGANNPASLTFTTANWDTPQTVTVTGLDDDIDDDQVVYAIVTAPATSTDPKYDGLNGADVSVTNLDDADTAGISVSPTSGLVTDETGGQDTFTIVLTSEPMANVTIGLTSSDTSEGTVSPTSVTFTAANWSTPQTVTVTGQNDDIDDESVAYTIVTAVASSTDPKYGGMNVPDVSVTNNDDADTAGIVVSPTSGLVTTEAGGTAQFTVRLTSEPLANVMIGLGSSDPTEGSVAASVTLTSLNWDTPQVVEVTGVGDFVDDGDIGYTIVTAAAVSSDPNYDGRSSPNVTVTNSDDDTAGIDVTPTSGLVTTEDGGSDQFSIVLTSEPTATVTIGLSSSDTSEGTVSPTSLLFTSANWSSPQPVTVTGVDDNVDDGNIGYTIVTGAASSSDGNYSGIASPDVSATNIDDDDAGLSIADLTVTEGTGGTTSANFAVTLNVASTQTIMVEYATAGGTALAPGDYTTTSGTLQFTPGETSETVTVAVQGDALDENPETFAVNLSNASAALIADGQATGTITDDDPTPSLSITNASVTEGNAGTVNAVFTVTLSAASGRTVTVQYATSDQTAVEPGDYTAASGALTFPPGVTTQQVIVAVQGDALDEANETFLVTLSGAMNATIDDTQGLGTINDDDTAGFTLAHTNGSTLATEGGASDSASVVLTSRPLTAVTFDATASNSG